MTNETNAISGFLKTFTDKALGDLEAHALDGTLNYEDCRHCLLSHHQLGYGVKYGDIMAQNAEIDFWSLGINGGQYEGYDGREPANELRRERILTFIEAEKNRRIDITLGAPPKPEPEETPVPEPVQEKEEEGVLV
jgi:hypothetical protein